MNQVQQTDGTTAPILYHDGCNICLDIAQTLGGTIPGLHIVNLGLQPELAPQASAWGVVDLPSLVIGGKVLPVSPHSRVDAH
jgi:hypothetical protein